MSVSPRQVVVMQRVLPGRARETSVEGVLRNVTKADVEVTRSEVVEILKELEAAGCGDFVVGRRGKPSRFVWTSSMVAVGRLAAGESVAEDQLEPPSEPAALREYEEPEVLTHQYYLRPGLKPLMLELPADLTVTEASRLAGFIRTLPLDQES